MTAGGSLAEAARLGDVRHEIERLQSLRLDQGLTPQELLRYETLLSEEVALLRGYPLADVILLDADGGSRRRGLTVDAGG